MTERITKPRCGRLNVIRLLTSVAVVAISVAACSSSASKPKSSATAKDGVVMSTDSVKITQPSVAASATGAPLFVADALHLWAKYGANVSIVQASSTKAIPLYLAGKMPLAAVDAGTVSAVLANNRPIQVYGISYKALSYQVWARPGITDPSQLKNKVMGISQPGGEPDYAAHAYLKKVGVDPGTVKFAPAGDVSGIVAAMASGSVDAGAFGPPSTTKAAKLGFNKLADLSDYNIPYPRLVIMGEPSWVKQHHAAALAYMEGWIEGLWVTLTQADQTKAILAKALDLDPTKDAATLDDDYAQVLAQAIRPADLGDNQASLSAFKDTFSEPTRIKDTKVLTPTQNLVAELQHNGFFDTLTKKYGPVPPLPAK